MIAKLLNIFVVSVIALFVILPAHAEIASKDYVDGLIDGLGNR